MKKLLFILFSSIGLSSFGQTEKEINEQVWKPFIKAQIDLDEQTYLSIHSSDIIRTERTNKKVYGYNTYAETIHEGFKRAYEAKEKGSKVELNVELRFLERISSEEYAYEVGYYKSKLIMPTGKEIVYYSQFHVSLRKENGSWKILTDSSLPMPDLTEDLFLTAKPMEI
jgi:hypothetical protein